MKAAEFGRAFADGESVADALDLTEVCTPDIGQERLLCD